MGLYERFDPPAKMQDLGRVPGLLDQWDHAVAHWFDYAVNRETSLYKKPASSLSTRLAQDARHSRGGEKPSIRITIVAHTDSLERHFRRILVTTNMETGKRVSLELVAIFCPNDVDAVEDGFDSLAASGFQVPKNIPQHAFHIPPEVWSYSQTVAIFVGGIFAGAVKDVLKGRLAKLLERLLEKDQPLTKTESEELLGAIDVEAEKLKIPDEHRKRLESDFKKVLILDRDAANKTAG
jgi:hypothetical protein